MKDFSLLGIAVNGPGLPDWPQARAALRGAKVETRPRETAAPPARMNSRDRRRASDTVRLAVEIGFEAVESAKLAPGDLQAIFASCHGEGAATHKLLAALTEPHAFVSPTLFHNSVHNTPAGYWSIAAGTRAPTTSLCAGHFTFAAALMKSAMIVELTRSPALIVAYDAPFPDPLSRLSPFPGPLGVGLVMAPADWPGAAWRISLAFERRSERARTKPRTEGFDLLFEANPIGQCLPLLEGIAREAEAPIVLDQGAAAKIVIEVQARGSRSD